MHIGKHEKTTRNASQCCQCLSFILHDILASQGLKPLKYWSHLFICLKLLMLWFARTSAGTTLASLQRMISPLSDRNKVVERSTPSSPGVWGVMKTSGSKRPIHSQWMNVLKTSHLKAMDKSQKSGKTICKTYRSCWGVSQLSTLGARWGWINSSELESEYAVCQLPVTELPFPKHPNIIGDIWKPTNLQLPIEIAI